jgi:hypothetical protein
MNGGRLTSFLSVGKEIVLLVSCYYAYEIGRFLAVDGTAFSAFDNAREVVGLERAVGLLLEPDLQLWLLEEAPRVVVLLNWYYILGYWPVILSTSAFLYVRNRQMYRRYRTTALIAFGVSLALYVIYPLAPPRMLPMLGFVDTIAMLGPAEYHAVGDALLYNPFAAMPSLHFGLSALMSFVYIRHGGIIWKSAGVGYLLVMLAAIVVTGNHYFLDAIVAIWVIYLSFVAYRVSARVRANLYGWLRPIWTSERRWLSGNQPEATGLRGQRVG